MDFYRLHFDKDKNIIGTGYMPVLPIERENVLITGNEPPSSGSHAFDDVKNEIYPTEYLDDKLVENKKPDAPKRIKITKIDGIL